MPAKVKSEWTGTTQFGFPSTIHQGQRVQKFKDKDPTTENENLVTKQNHMQAAIKSMRKEVAEQGGGGNQGAFEKKDGTFGGMTRVLEGFVKQNDEFKCVPKATRRFVNSNTSAIREANKKGGAIVKRELSTQQTEADAKVTTQIPVEKRMMPSQLTIDSKLASMKAAAFKKFGGNNLSAKTFIKERQTQKWIQKRVQRTT